jgi:hypothetical protein
MLLFIFVSYYLGADALRGVVHHPRNHPACGKITFRFISEEEQTSRKNHNNQNQVFLLFLEWEDA